MSTKRQWLLALHMALLKALEATTAEHVRAVGAALDSIESSDDLDEDRATAAGDEALQKRCDELTRRLAHKLATAAPDWLTRVLRTDHNDDPDEPDEFYQISDDENDLIPAKAKGDERLVRLFCLLGKSPPYERIEDAIDLASGWIYSAYAGEAPYWTLEKRRRVLRLARQEMAEVSRYLQLLEEGAAVAEVELTREESESQ